MRPLRKLGLNRMKSNKLRRSTTELAKMALFGLLCLLMAWLIYNYINTQAAILGVDWWGYLTIVITDALLRVLVIILVLISMVQAVGLYVLANRDVEVTGVNAVNIKEIAKRVEAHVEARFDKIVENRGKGRPKHPCVAAKIGMIDCPLVPDAFEPSEKMVKKITEKILETTQKQEKETSLSEKPTEPKAPQKQKQKQKPDKKADKKAKQKKSEKEVAAFLVNLLERASKEGKKR